MLLSAIAAALPPAARSAGPDLGPRRNDAVLRALKAHKQSGEVSSGDVSSRLAGALGQLQRARRLAATGAVRDARGLLREGGMKTVRTDAAAAAVALGGVTPAWDNGLLDAFDDALRVAERGGGESSDAVAKAGAELEVALRQLIDATRAAVVAP